MAVREVLESRNFTRDFLSKRQATRVFQVDADTEEAALTAVGIPLDNDPYPSDAGCKCDKRTATPIPGFNVYNVTCTYSSDRSGGMPQVKDKLSPGYYRLFEGFEDAEITFPIMREKKEKVSNGGNSVEILVYEAIDKKVSQKRAYMGVEVITPFLNIGQMEYIAEQCDKVHELRPQSFWLFQGAEMHEYERDQTKQVVRYKWQMDPGSPDPTENGPLPDGIWAPIFPRDPYSEWVVSGFLASGEPVFDIFYTKPKDDLFGWIALPGIPLL